MALHDKKDWEAAQARVHDAYGFLHIDELEGRLEQLDAQAADPDFWNDAARAQAVSKQASDVRDTIAEYKRAEQLLSDAQAASELAEEDEAFAEEFDHALDALEQLLDDLEVQSWFSGEFDGGDAIVSVNPGQGGLEAQDWT